MWGWGWPQELWQDNGSDVPEALWEMQGEAVLGCRGLESSSKVTMHPQQSLELSQRICVRTGVPALPQSARTHCTALQ